MTGERDTVRVLVTGFGAFGNRPVNPSAQVARALDGERSATWRIIGTVLDTATASAGVQLAAALESVKPALLVSLGVAPGRPAVSLERVALNVRDFTIPDIDGARVVDEPVIAGASDALFTGLPTRAILAAWEEAGIPGHLSNSAGTYLCNQVFYLGCHEGRRRHIPAGFIHVPDTLESARAGGGFGEPPPTLALATTTEAIRLAIRVCLDRLDAKTPTGTPQGTPPGTP